MLTDLWLINTHNGIKEKGIKPIQVEDFPSIKEHLDKYYPQLEKRQDKGDTPYNLRNCAYMEDFYKQKVIWKIIGSNINFCFDNEKYFCNNAVNIMTGAPTLLLQFIGLMNSSLFNWYLKLTTEAEVQGEGIQLYATTIENTPVKLDFDEEFSNLVYQRQRKKIPDCILDEYIYKLYNLTHEEITFIKNSF